MFDISFAELLLLSVVALVILGPERLPVVLRMLGLWFGRLRRMYSNVKLEIEREVGMDDIRRQLHNEKIMAELKDVENQSKALKQDVNSISLNEPTPPVSTIKPATSSEPEDVAREG